MLLLAVTALDKLQTLPPDVLLKIGIAVGGFIIAIFDKPQRRALHDHICNTRVVLK